MNKSDEKRILKKGKILIRKNEIDGKFVIEAKTNKKDWHVHMTGGYFDDEIARDACFDDLLTNSGILKYE